MDQRDMFVFGWSNGYLTFQCRMDGNSGWNRSIDIPIYRSLSILHGVFWFGYATISVERHTEQHTRGHNRSSRSVRAVARSARATRRCAALDLDLVKALHRFWWFLVISWDLPKQLKVRLGILSKKGDVTFQVGESYTTCSTWSVFLHFFFRPLFLDLFWKFFYFTILYVFIILKRDFSVSFLTSCNPAARRKHHSLMEKLRRPLVLVCDIQTPLECFFFSVHPY